MGPEVIDKIRKYVHMNKDKIPLHRLSMLRTFYARHRTHSSLAHYSIGLFPFALLAQLIFHYNDNPMFRFTSVFLTICGTIMLIPAFISGFTTLWLNRGFKIKGNLNLKIKILLTPVSAVLSLIATYIGITENEPFGFGYTTLLFIIWIFMILMEFNGNKLTFKDIY